MKADRGLASLHFATINKWLTSVTGFIASHLAKRLKSEGHYIVACDWKRNEHMPVSLWSTEHIPWIRDREQRAVRVWQLPVSGIKDWRICSSPAAL